MPYAAGTMGHLGTTASGWAMANCDSLLIVGSNDPWTEFYPPPGAARAVQIDNDPKAIGNRYPVEIALTGDAAESLRALLPLVEERIGWRADVERQVSAWRSLSEARALTAADPVNPERAVRELNGRLPDNAQVAVDVGSCVYWYARQLHLPRGVPAHLSSTLASMGCGIPYGIAAKLAAPDRPVVVLSGDGGFQMTGMAELITVARLWKAWKNPVFAVCILNNRDLSEVSWEQRETESEPRFDDSQDIPDVDYSGYAKLLGLDGMRVENPDDVGQAWDRALAADRPFVLDVRTDADVPLLPPFPAGQALAESMEKALETEGNRHALDLLREYVRLETQAQP